MLRHLAAGLGEVHQAAEPDGRHQSTGTAVGIDARNGPAHLAELPQVIAGLEALGVDARIVFVEADDATLIQRFSETRRKHPLTQRDRSLAEAIALERELLAPLREVAEVHLDSTHTNVHELRDLVRERLHGSRAVAASVLLQSFGFKNGLPNGVDFVFDVRCLPNPYWEPALRRLTGLDQPVIDFLDQSGETAQMRTDLSAFLERWIPRFETDGRSYLTIAIGCTGGQHRSVYMVEALRQHLRDLGRRVLVRHRELP